MTTHSDPRSCRNPVTVPEESDSPLEYKKTFHRLYVGAEWERGAEGERDLEIIWADVVCRCAIYNCENGIDHFIQPSLTLYYLGDIGNERREKRGGRDRDRHEKILLKSE